MKNQSRGAPSPSFAALRELARVYKVFLQQTLFAWPTRYSSSLVVDTALDKFWNKARLGEIFEQCIHELKAQLGPAYQKLFNFDDHGFSDEVETRVEFNPVDFREITDTLDEWAPEWSLEFILERQPIHCATLFQVHNAVDENGQRWQIKVLKPSARKKMESSLHALREIEAALKPLRNMKAPANLLAQVEKIRRTLSRSADLNIERRVLLRLKNKIAGDNKTSLRLPKIHERFGSEAVMVYEAMEGQAFDPETFDASRLDATRKLSLLRQPLQASLLKAFEIGLIRSRADTSKLVLMKDGSIAVSRGWAAVVPDGTDRTQAANLLRAFYVNDFSPLSDLLSKRRVSKAKEKDAVADNWQQKLKDMSKGIENSSLVERAAFAIEHAEAAGIELPLGFLDTAKSLQSLEGIGKPLVAVMKSMPFIATTGRAVVAHEIALNTQISRARRLHRR